MCSMNTVHYVFVLINVFRVTGVGMPSMYLLIIWIYLYKYNVFIYNNKFVHYQCRNMQILMVRHYSVQWKTRISLLISLFFMRTTNIFWNKSRYNFERDLWQAFSWKYTKPVSTDINLFQDREFNELHVFTELNHLVSDNSLQRTQNGRKIIWINICCVCTFLFNSNKQL